MRPFDVSKFRTAITKSIDGISIGFHDPTVWIPTGNYALNYLISGSFFKGIPLGKITVFGGVPGSGKSYLASGTIIKNAQEQGIFVILIDSENALDESWLRNLGVDTSEDKLLKVNMAMINDVAKFISDFVKDFREMPVEDRPKILFVIDSLGMLLAPAQVTQFQEGDLAGDFGIKAKQLKALITNCINMFGDLDIGMVATNHVYQDQKLFSSQKLVQSGGSGFMYAASIVIAMEQFKLKDDESKEKKSNVIGIRSKCQVMKTRYAKPFEAIEVQIPYATGIDPYSGLFDLFEKRNLLVRTGNQYAYTDATGAEHKYFKAGYLQNKDAILDLIMKQHND
ncbi:Protein RecA [uncultured archaeon]|nr:Protein RecA [uncultured archaeon]